MLPVMVQKSDLASIETYGTKPKMVYNKRLRQLIRADYFYL
jgi:hypothetical protein